MIMRKMTDRNTPAENKNLQKVYCKTKLNKPFSLSFNFSKPKSTWLDPKMSFKAKR